MKYYLCLFFGVMIFSLVGFGLATWTNPALLTDPTPWMGEGKLFAVVLGLFLLCADILIPVPATLVMMAFGVGFGVIGGTLLSLLGGVMATWTGFWLGRRGGHVLNRVVPPAEQARAKAMIGRWGPVAVVVTRPIPLLSESVAILAGTSTMSWGQVTWAAVAGVLPAAFLYALTGATALRFDTTAWVFGLVLLPAAVLWLAGRPTTGRENDSSISPEP